MAFFVPLPFPQKRKKSASRSQSHHRVFRKNCVFFIIYYNNGSCTFISTTHPSPTYRCKNRDNNIHRDLLMAWMYDLTQIGYCVIISIVIAKLWTQCIGWLIWPISVQLDIVFFKPFCKPSFTILYPWKLFILIFLLSFL